MVPSWKTASLSERKDGPALERLRLSERRTPLVGSLLLFREEFQPRGSAFAEVCFSSEKNVSRFRVRHPPVNVPRRVTRHQLGEPRVRQIHIVASDTVRRAAPRRLGLPIARWADRGNRTTIASIAIGVWGATVMTCLWVTNFVQLVAARIAAAGGEVSVTPVESA